MTQYEKMARRVVEDGLKAFGDDILDFMQDPGRDSDDYEKMVSGFTDAIMLGLKELLKEDKIRIFNPDKLMSNLG